MICGPPHLLCHFVGAFLIFRVLLMLTRVRHNFGSAKDQVLYPDGMELYRAVIELCHLEFVSLRKASPLTEGSRSRASQRASLLSSAWKVVRRWVWSAT